MMVVERMLMVLAKLLTILMLILIIISFVSSRYLLKTLGVEDFGIYSVVGSVAATFVSLKSLFSELEKGEASARREGWISLDDAEKRLGL